MSFNLPPGVLQSDLDGPPMPKCKRCGQEFNPELDETICDECHPPKPDNEDAQEILRARNEALLAVAEAANELFQFGYIKRCEAQEALATALADLTQAGWKAGVRDQWPPLPEIKPITTVLTKL